MGVSKINYGTQTLLDLTSDTVAVNTLAAGVTAHNAAGEQITGTYYGVPNGGAPGTFLIKKTEEDGDSEWKELDPTAINAERRKLIFNNIIIGPNNRVTDNSYSTVEDFDNFPYIYAYYIDGISAVEHFAEAIFSFTEAINGLFAPICETVNGAVLFFCEEELLEDLVIPTLVIWQQSSQIVNMLNVTEGGEIGDVATIGEHGKICWGKVNAYSKDAIRTMNFSADVNAWVLDSTDQMYKQSLSRADIKESTIVFLVTLDQENFASTIKYETENGSLKLSIKTKPSYALTGKFLLIDVESGEGRMSVRAGESSILTMYPIGSLYQTADENFNPNDTWGGTWQRTAGELSYTNGGSLNVIMWQRTA